MTARPLTDYEPLAKLIFEGMGWKTGDWENVAKQFPETRRLYLMMARDVYGEIAKSCCSSSCGLAALLTSGSGESSAAAP